MRTPLVKSAVRVLDLLELLAAARGPLRLTEVAKRLDIPKSSAFGLLSTLVAKGYAEEQRNGFVLVDRLREGGWVGGDVASLVRVSRRVMAELARETGESAFLGVMTAEREMLYLEKSLSPNPIRYDTDLEQPRPAYCTSIGLALLADLPDAEIEAYFEAAGIEARTPYTITERAVLWEMVREAREDGVVHMTNSNVEGVAGVAAVIRGTAGRALAGFALIGPTERFNAALGNHRLAIKRAAAEASRLLAGGSAVERGEAPERRKTG